MSAITALHIAAGIVALVAGFIALYAAKGAWLHRRSGNIFSYAMLLMTALGTLMALTTHPNRINVIAGSLTFYLVATGLLTVIRSVEQQRRWLLGLSAIAAIVTVAAWQYGMLARVTPGGKIDHIPAGAIFMFATVGTFGVIGDARTLWRGRIEGRQRLTRHLWRMGLFLSRPAVAVMDDQHRHLGHARPARANARHGVKPLVHAR